MLLLSTMEQQIINFLTEFTYDIWGYVKITDQNTLQIIYNLLINDEDTEEEQTIIQNPILCYYYGIHYHYRGNKELMKKCYKKAIKYGIIEAMDALAHYYYEHHKQKKMMKYYLLAIENSNKSSMFHLGLYYCNRQDYEQMEKYYLMAANHGHVNSMFYLGDYYQRINNDEKMKK